MHSPQADTSWELALSKHQDITAEIVNKEPSALQATVGEPDLILGNADAVDSGLEVTAVSVNSEEVWLEEAPTSDKENEPHQSWSTHRKVTLAGGKMLQLATAALGAMHDAPTNVLQQSQQGEAGLHGSEGENKAETTVKMRAKRNSEAAVVRETEGVGRKKATKHWKGNK
ncbi:hypothetical protein RhiTH_003642 [Rhizoctonia solani]